MRRLMTEWWTRQPPDPVVTFLPVALASLALIIAVTVEIYRWRRGKEEKRQKIVPINPDAMNQIKNGLETGGNGEKQPPGRGVRLTATDGTIVTLMNTHSMRVDALKKAINHAIENDSSTDLSHQVETNRWKAFKKKLSREAEQEAARGSEE